MTPFDCLDDGLGAARVACGGRAEGADLVRGDHAGPSTVEEVASIVCRIPIVWRPAIG
ncbi:hypothetical protein GCM10020220_101630 [Nonomuraea rubra]